MVPNSGPPDCIQTELSQKKSQRNSAWVRRDKCLKHFVELTSYAWRSELLFK